MGVEPLNTRERISGDIAINQRTAPLSSNYLAHFCECSWDKTAVCHSAILRTVSIHVHRQGPGGGRGDKGCQNQKNGSTGQVHFLRLSVRHLRWKKLSFLLGLHLADWLSLGSRRQFRIQFCDLKHLTGTKEKRKMINQRQRRTEQPALPQDLMLSSWNELIKDTLLIDHLACKTPQNSGRCTPHFPIAFKLLFQQLKGQKH